MKIKQSLKKRLLGKARTTILAIAALIMAPQAALAQTVPIQCTSEGLAYVITFDEGQYHLYSLSVNDPNAVATRITTFPIGVNPNSLGLDDVGDGYLFALDYNTGALLKIDANGAYGTVAVNDPNTLLKAGYSAGGIAADGMYYAFHNNFDGLGADKLVRINITETTPTVSEVVLSGDAFTGSIDDIVPHPIQSNLLFSVTSTNQLVQIDLNTGIVTNRGSVTATGLTAGTNGTLFMDATGNLFFGHNQNSILYKLDDPLNGTAPFGATEYSNALVNATGQVQDGARCFAVVAPSANPDTRALTDMSTVSIPVIAGPGTGTDGQGSLPIDPTSIILTVPTTGHGLTNPVVSNGGKTLTADEGIFQVNEDGTVSFTPTQNFNKSILVNYTIKDTGGNESNVTTITITADGTLPVDFGTVYAAFVNGQLVVNWSTLTESGNSYFDIEVSKDGENFTKIGSVDSKANGGYSDVAIDYDFSVNLQNGNTLLGIALFSIAFIALLFSRKNKWLYTVVLVGGLSIFGASSCSKNDAAGIEDSGKVFVRIKQVDIDGKFTYSKPVQVVRK
ncbi:MAG: cadherin-like domain-containing protein [Niabella sp.]